MQHIVKRKGHKEPFDERKIYASVYAACVSLRISDEEAETISQLVTDEVKDEIKTQEVITREHLHLSVVQSLKKYQPDAAYMYQTHRDVS